MPWYRIGGAMVHMNFGRAGNKKAAAPCCAPLELGGKLVRCMVISTFLCDHDTGEGTTCDAPLCADHATEVGKDRHYCPRHLALHRERSPELF
jgi:hypothetical protein